MADFPFSLPRPPILDEVVRDLDRALRTVSGVAQAQRANPANACNESALDAQQKKHAAGLMRINHVGEVCAQALYNAQARFAENPQLRAELAQAGREEEDHLAWTAERLQELGYGVSILNPLWYAASYALGAAAAKLGDAASLGFVVETERQVEAHLASHLQMLPAEDAKSRAIVEQMRVDEMQHGAHAQAMGAAAVPFPVQKIMQAMAKVMTTSAYHI
ncbi:2-polyprenyl-3-methyl-6-methoxy-1,4-benzoquinone monooxygenase [Massilia sp. W12]|uniref:2-polyprenyl-3-methyl-6-methoxy-1,4-benzoquinone monooxygenase n=1 Tax=Massilia sp. W12 TaxID=3126507 RepID=UPI0030CD80A0